jgi:ATP-dependent Lon protease
MLNMFNLNRKRMPEMEEVLYPLLPLRDVVVFPHMVVPLFVGRDKSIKALEWAMSHEKEIFLSAQRDAKVDIPAQKDIYLFGTMGTVLQLLRLPDGTVKALIEGKQRARIEELVPTRTLHGENEEVLRRRRTSNPSPHEGHCREF